MNKEELKRELRWIYDNYNDRKAYYKLEKYVEKLFTKQESVTNESELIEGIENILYKHIKSICKINSIIDDITQFRNHQNNKDENRR